MQYIDPQKVLLITNTTFAQSGIDAADYITKRGLNPNHKLAFNFGASHHVDGINLVTPSLLSCQTSGPYYGQSIRDAIINYTDDHEIDAIIFSTWTPHGLSWSPMSLPAWAGHIRQEEDGHHWSLQGQYWALSTNSTSWPGGLDYATPENQDASSRRNSVDKIIQQVVHNWKPSYRPPQSSTNVNPYNKYKSIPHGRLGCPNIFSNQIEEWTLNENVGFESIYNRAVTKALLAEQQNHLHDSHVLSQVLNYTAGNAGMPMWANKAAFQWALRMGMTKVYDVYDNGRGLLQYDPSDTAYLGYGVSATSSTIPIDGFQVPNVVGNDARNFPPSGIVKIRCLPIMRTLNAINIGDTSCQVDTRFGFTYRGGNTVLGPMWTQEPIQNEREIFTGSSYCTITGTSSPYTLHFPSPATKAHVSGIGITIKGDSIDSGNPAWSTFYVKYTGIQDNSALPYQNGQPIPNYLTGCTRADTEVSLRDQGRYPARNAEFYSGPPPNTGYQIPTDPSKLFTSAAFYASVIPYEPASRQWSWIASNYSPYYYGETIPCVDPAISSIFCIAIGAPRNNVPVIRDQFVGRLADGAWGSNWTSGSFLIGKAIMAAGGSATVMSHDEPFNYGITPTHELFIYASYYKMSIMEANFHARGGHPNNTVFGDPLYRPYLSTPTTQINVSQTPYGI